MKRALKTFSTLMEEHNCTAEERHACAEYLAFLRFRRLMRTPDALRFLFLFFGEDFLS